MKEIPTYEEKRIEVSGFTIALKIWNPKKTNVVLGIHGKLDNAASFDLLAPLFPHLQFIAIDYPGTGFSSAYPDGILPHWKNDAFLILQLIDALKLDNFDIIAHSLGSLLATILAIARPKQVKKIVFLDILGPTVNFIEKGMTYLERDIETFLTYKQWHRTEFLSQESAIQDRMKIGNISYQAAKALVLRGVKQSKEGWHWTFDQKLRCISSTVPYEDELLAMFQTLQTPVCLIRAQQGVPYPDNVFNNRAQAIKNLSIRELQGGHHVHMDDPIPVAKIISQFLDGSI